VTDGRTVVRPVRAPRLEVELVRSRLAAKLYGVASEAPKIAHYEIVARIGAGGQGDVYLVHDPRLQRRLAIKVLRRDVDRAGIAEARALAQIVHPNVVPVFDVGVVPGVDDEGPRAYIVMEYVAGRSLQAWCEGGTSWAERLRVLVDVGRGLQAAHAAGIVHGDVKPSNVMVGDDGRPRVMDFGLARWGPEPSSDAESQTDAGGGTPGFRAPESDTRPADARSDQYGFCATAWRLLVELPSSSSPGRRDLERVRSILQRGLQTRPEDRWPDLGRLLEQLGRTDTPPRRLRRIAVAAGVGALAWWGVAIASTPTPADGPRGVAAAFDTRSLQADLLVRLGRAQWDAGRVDEARLSFERAAHLATARGDDRVSAEATLWLVDLLGRRLSAFDEARRWEAHARAAIARLDDRDLAAKLDYRWGTILGLAGDSDGGRAVLLELRERLIADPSITSVAPVDVESALARLETQAGRSVEALQWAERAVAGQAARVGTEHPAYLQALVRLGAAQEQRADLAGARRSFEQALASYERSGNETGALGTRNSLAIVLERQGDLDAAAREYDLVMRTATELRLDDMIVMTRANLGALALARRDPDTAVEHFTIARTSAEGMYPPDHHIFGVILYGLGVAYGRRDEPERAVPLLERALDLVTAKGASTGDLGKHRYVLGQARWRLPEPDARARGRAEVEQGRRELASDPEAYAQELAEAEAWLKTHRLDDGGSPRQ